MLEYEFRYNHFLKTMFLDLVQCNYKLNLFLIMSFHAKKLTIKRSRFNDIHGIAEYRIKSKFN